MLPKSLSADTSSEVERLQIEGWRLMSPAQKAAIVSGLTQAVYDLARAGIRHGHPNASPREQFLRLAIVTLGPDLARNLGIIRVQGPRLDRDYLAVNAPVLSVADLLARALREAAGLSV